MMSQFPHKDINHHVEEVLDGLMHAKRVIFDMLTVSDGMSDEEFIRELEAAPEYNRLLTILDRVEVLVREVWPGTFEEVIKGEEAEYDRQEQLWDATQY